MSAVRDTVMGQWPGQVLDRVEHIGTLVGQWQDRNDSRVPTRAIGAANEAIDLLDLLVCQAKALRAELVQQVEDHGESV